ncbi:MBL fold metallo-hydrolase [Myceligenerans crystallogenes]|uniref:Ribonuclease Z n=1 Tax=Myceligenerans crystallogenes TaxID=316335 RepID=A0ABN2N7D1_9MICO
MSRRELVVLGTSSQVPTRTRNHNGYLLYWDSEAILFDPGDGTQRQMIHAGVAASDITRIALTHLHGDHSLGLAGVVQRISLDTPAGRAARSVPVSFPASGEQWVRNLCDATVFHHRERLVLQPLAEDGVVPRVDAGSGVAGAAASGIVSSGIVLTARRLDHTVEAFGYRLDEPDGVRFDPGLLARAGVAGPEVGRLRAAGSLTRADGSVVRLEEVTVPQRGQSFAFVMDTRRCDAVGELADGVDLLVIESTYLDRDAGLAAAHGHLTALQAARVAAECGVRHLVLTHFSQRYETSDGSGPAEFEREARTVYDGGGGPGPRAGAEAG